jgi:tRNA uridine 5-carboxymethylaminomethyl modification enzyme
MGISLGCVVEGRHIVFDRKATALAAAKSALLSTNLTPHQIEAAGIKISQDGMRRSAFQLLSFPDVSRDIVDTLCPAFALFPADIKDQSAKDALYAQYLARQLDDVAALQSEENHLIPPEFGYADIPGLSNELKQKLAVRQPPSLAHAGRMEGMTPAALTLILAHLRRADRRRAV